MGTNILTDVTVDLVQELAARAADTGNHIPYADVLITIEALNLDHEQSESVLGQLETLGVDVQWEQGIGPEADAGIDAAISAETDASIADEAASQSDVASNDSVQQYLKEISGSAC